METFTLLQTFPTPKEGIVIDRVIPVATIHQRNLQLIALP
jgi:hypothetical protein